MKKNLTQEKKDYNQKILAKEKSDKEFKAQELERETEKFNKEIVTLTKQSFKYALKPFEYFDLAFALLDKGVEKGILTQDYVNKKKLDLMKKMTTPSRAKEYLKQKLISARNKIKDKLI
jgi:hypothetical protein